MCLEQLLSDGFISAYWPRSTEWTTWKYRPPTLQDPDGEVKRQIDFLWHLSDRNDKNYELALTGKRIDPPSYEKGEKKTGIMEYGYPSDHILIGCEYIFKPKKVRNENKYL